MSLRNRTAAMTRERRQTGLMSPKGVFIAERRRHPRFNLELPLSYSIENKDHYGGVAANASRGGLGAYLPAAIVVGTSLNIEIIFARGFGLNSIRMKARVIWSDMAPKVTWGEYRYGLEFEKFQHGDVQKLNALLKEAVRRAADQERIKVVRNQPFPDKVSRIPLR